MSESLIRYNLKDGTSVLIPFSKWMRMTDQDFDDFDTGNAGRFARIMDDSIDLEVNNTTLFEDDSDYSASDDILYDIEDE